MSFAMRFHAVGAVDFVTPNTDRTASLSAFTPSHRAAALGLTAAKPP